MPENLDAAPLGWSYREILRKSVFLGQIFEYFLILDLFNFNFNFNFWFYLEAQSFFFRKWACFCSDHFYFSRKRLKHKDCSSIKPLYFREKCHSLKNNNSYSFFWKSLCSPILRDLDQDIWQIIFKLNLFRPTLVRFLLSLVEAAPEGGTSFGSPRR